MNDNEYWQDGKRHRLNGPAVETFRMGSRYREWWQNGRLERKNGPAVQWSFIEEWWRNGQRLRMKGPPVIQRSPTQVMPQPPIPCPLYPDYDTPNPPPKNLKNFLEQEIPQVSDWFDKTCYGWLGFFTSHGDFGAYVATMLDAFHPRVHSSGNMRAQMEEKITVKIVIMSERTTY